MGYEGNGTEDRVLAALTHLKPVPNPDEELERLFREHSSHVFRAAYRITGRVADAEDVLQTVFMRLARREGPSELREDAGPYLRRAAVNAALDVVRARKRSRSVAIDDVDPAAIASPADGLETERRDAQLREIIRSAATTLKGRAAEAFVLRYFEGYENHEIAEALGTSAMVVAVLLHRARARVRKQLGKLIEDSYL
jgi:RNA polymerase sigma-70 factor, ECF subfamily